MAPEQKAADDDGNTSPPAAPQPIRPAALDYRGPRPRAERISPGTQFSIGLAAGCAAAFALSGAAWTGALSGWGVSRLLGVAVAV
ncbi:MAG: hypothetical protein JWO31_2105 [Phycisphaerales bacterium]|nr:hypothetical protein [Phycisphaerales bacterium]